MTRLMFAVLMAAALAAAPRATAQDVIAPPGALIVQIPPPEPAKPAPPALAPGPRAATPAPPAAAPPPPVAVPAAPPAAVPAKPSRQAAGAAPAAAASPVAAAQSSPPATQSSPPAAQSSPPAVPSSPAIAAPAPPLPPAVPPPAVPPLPADAGARYSFQRVQDTLVRLDSRTGQVSVCSQAAGGWSCLAVPDDRAALESEIGRLLGENAVLKQQLAARNPPSLGAPQPTPLAKPPTAAPDKGPDKTPEVGPQTHLPSDAELDRAMNFLTKAWRRMVEMMVELQRDIRRRD